MSFVQIKSQYILYSFAFLKPFYKFKCFLVLIVYYFWEKAMAPHSSTLAWKIPWMEEPGRLQSMGWLIVGHD